MPRPINAFYNALKAHRAVFSQTELAEYFLQVDQSRITQLAGALSEYIATNLPTAINRRSHLGDYRTNPYVLMTSASSMQLLDASRFAEFLVNNKLYMGLETSFGKSIESRIVGFYPIGSSVPERWGDPPEKVAESMALAGLSLEERARTRTNSVWREIDKSCVIGNRRFMTSIKSGPNTINDTQVEAMKNAIAVNYQTWRSVTNITYPHVNQTDLIIGLTYGTDKTTNNKENQILVKLLEHGFEEEDRGAKPGVLIDSETRSFRIYRRIGRDFWAMIGKPDDPESARFVFIEVLLGLAKGLSEGAGRQVVQDGLNAKVQELALAIARITFPRAALPAWLRADFSDPELVWLAAAMTAFYDEGI